MLSDARSRKATLALSCSDVGFKNVCLLKGESGMIVWLAGRDGRLEKG